MNVWLYFFAFLYGIAFGSFLNVCIYRIPQERDAKGRSLLTRSRCPHCGAAVRFYDNIPLLSYLVLRGRCRDCSATISPRYFAVELTTGLLLVLCLWRFDLSWAFALNALFLCAILTLTVIDYDHQILPNVITLPGAVLGFLLSPLQDPDFYRDAITSALASLAAPAGKEDLAMAFMASLLGLLIGGGLLWLVAELYFRLRKVEGLGFGDVKMMAMVGAFLGWRYALLTVFLGSISGSIVGVALMRIQHRDAQHPMPFGTFLGAGAAICVFVGPDLLRWYLGFF